MSTLRDRLRQRQLPTEVVELPLDPAEFAARDRALTSAQWALETARDRGSGDLGPFRAELAAAQSALAQMEVISVTLRALPAADWEALLELHPPTDAERDKGAQWAPSFRLALVAASVVPADGEAPTSEADWEAMAKDGSLGAGEINALFTVALNLNLRAPDSHVGKG